MERNLREKNIFLKTTNYFFVTNLILGFVHFIIIMSLIYKPAIVADSFFKVLLFPEIYLTVLPLAALYIVAYFVIKSRSIINRKIFIGSCAFVVLFYFGCAINKYYPESLVNKIIDNFLITNKLNKQAESQKKYAEEVKDYFEFESIDNISFHLDDNKDNLIIKYNDMYSKYESITKKEYDEFFEIGKVYDSSLKETIYSNNELAYKIISSSFYTYISVDDEKGFLVYAYKDFDKDRFLTMLLTNYVYINGNKIHFGEELNRLLYQFNEIEPFTKNEIKRENNIIKVIGNTKGYRWNIVKDEKFEFTLKGENLDLNADNFSIPGEYVIKLEKEFENSFVNCSNTLIVKID